jgi:magnesium-transporting ATPase (P-type)
VFSDFFIAMYNIFYTSQPVVLMAALDQDVKAETSLAYPKLMEPGLRNLFFNRTKFAASAWQGLWTSFVLVALGIGN